MSNEKKSKNNYLCRNMGRLTDDITTFLEGNGIGCIRDMRSGFEVICAKPSEGRTAKTIVPLEITAKSMDEAEISSKAAYKAIEDIKSYEGRPLIITEDRWNSQRPMMEARLLAHLEIFTSVFARNCIVRKTDRAEARAFLAANHSYGYAACRHHYGLFTKSDSRLIAVATFSNARKWIKDGKEIRSYEWTRYASLPGVRICGGMGKLLKAFINDVRPDDIMSYADLEWSEGEVYRTLGFIREESKGAVFFRVNPETWERRAIRHANIPDGDAESCGEEAGMFLRNFGSAKYRMKLTDY